ncbi:MAG: TFIIB-type zinc ribbon-containing protein [Planctomycetota bacterium]
MDDVTPPKQSEPTAPAAPGTTSAAVHDDADKGTARNFPCESCGADLTFDIEMQSLTCPYCGFAKELQDSGKSLTENDFREMARRMIRMRDQGRHDEKDLSEVTCDGCGGTVRFAGTLTSRECAYCGAPLQRENVHDAPHRIPVDGVMPFMVPREKARENLRVWIKSLWFAPTEFTRRGVEGKFSGIYLPYWTFDSLTFNVYSGERGEFYYVTVGTGKNRRRVRKTRWYPASGEFKRFFDDVLVVAGKGLPEKRIRDLEPWPLKTCIPFTTEVLSGFLARTYDVALDAGFLQARKRIDEAVEAEVRGRIGGDTQRIHSVNTQFNAITYKHLLLPVWMMTYRYNQKPYQVVVNAGTGEVQGDRPYSWLKITFAALGAIAVIGAIAWLSN